MLRRAQGFTLAFAQCNQPVERRRLVSELRKLLGDYRIGEVKFTEPIENLLDELIPRLSEYNDARVLFVYGLEHSIRSDQDFSPVVANLNISRNLFPRHISFPVVLWLPAYAIAAVMRGAPDFFSWRSAVFQFLSSPEMLSHVVKSALSGDFQAAFNLTAEEKEDRIAVIQNLLNEYVPLPSDRHNRQAEGRLFDRLADLYYSLGDYEQAEHYYQQNLEIAQQLEDRSGIASSLHNLGRIALLRGDYAKAENYYRESLEIRQELGDRNGIFTSLHNLGNIAYLREDYRQAQDYYQQSLKIAQELGNRSYLAGSLHQLGMIAHHPIGDYGQAEDYYQQSLKIAQALGDRSGIARSLHNLGIVAQDRGDYRQAEEYYQQGLRIAQELGDRSGIASSLIQLALLYAKQEDIDRAVQLMTIARDISARIGLYYREQAEEQIARLQGQVEEGRFEALVKEAQADPEKVIREVLGAVGN